MWFVIFLTFAIYLRAGSVIYEKRRQFRKFGGIESIDSDAPSETPILKLAGIQVTSEIACSSPERYSTSPSDGPPTRSFTASSVSPYSVTIESGPFEPIIGLQTADAVLIPTSESSSRPGPSPLRTEVSMRNTRFDGVDSFASQRQAVATEASSAAWAYTKYAMLFFIALLVTWVGYPTFARHTKHYHTNSNYM